MSGTRADARKRQEERAASNDRWSVVVYRDGEPVSGTLPCTDWDAATVVAPWFAGWLGGPVSVVNAIAAARFDPESQRSLFDAAGDEPLTDEEWIGLAAAAGFEP